MLVRAWRGRLACVDRLTHGDVMRAGIAVTAGSPGVDTLDVTTRTFARPAGLARGSRSHDERGYVNPRSGGHRAKHTAHVRKRHARAESKQNGCFVITRTRNRHGTLVIADIFVCQFYSGKVTFVVVRGEFVVSFTWRHRSYEAVLLRFRVVGPALSFSHCVATCSHPRLVSPPPTLLLASFLFPLL
mgnify:CR=1 FL=1